MDINKVIEQFKLESVQKSVVDIWEKFQEYFEKSSFFKKCLIVGGISLASYNLVVYPLYTYIYRKYKNYPNGLFGVPYFGSLFTMVAYGELNFYHKLLPKYGKITMYKMGGTNMLLVNDFNILKTILCNDNCLKRPWQFSAIFNSTVADNMECNFACCNDKWFERRKFMYEAITTITNANYIEPQLSTVLNERIYPRLENVILGKNNNEKHLWNALHDLRNLSFNVTFGAIYGYNECLDADSEQYKSMIKSLNDGLEIYGLSLLSYLFYIPNIFGLRNLIDKSAASSLEAKWHIWDSQLNSYFESNFKKCKNIENNNETLEAVTVFDELYKGWSKYPMITKEMFRVDVIELIGVAVETTASSLNAFIKLAANDLKLQEELYNELKQHSKYNETTKKLEFITSDFKQCVKFRAFINESFRVACTVPKGLPRMVDETHVIKYNVDKQTGQAYDVVFEKLSENNHNKNDDNNKKYEFEYIIDDSFFIEFNFNHIMREEKQFWGDKPNEFNINHWIKYDNNNEIKFRNRIESNMFSYGRRNCPGQSIARKAINLVMGNLLLNYKFKFENENDSKNQAIAYGFGTHIAPLVPVIVIPRVHNE